MTPSATIQRNFKNLVRPNPHFKNSFGNANEVLQNWASFTCSEILLHFHVTQKQIVLSRLNITEILKKK